MELYSGHSQPVHLIVMCAVAYYIPDKKKMVEDAISWLDPGGHFIMIHTLPHKGLEESLRKSLTYGLIKHLCRKKRIGTHAVSFKVCKLSAIKRLILEILNRHLMDVHYYKKWESIIHVQ